MSKETTAVAVKEKESKFTEYIPFGAQDKIKLSIEMVKNLIAVKTKSGKTCSETDAIKFVAMCQARRLNPFEGDAFLIGYEDKDGVPKYSLITAHQAFLKRAEMHPEFDGMKSGIIIERDGEVRDLEGDFYMEGDKLLGGWATVFFKNRKQPMHKRIRLKRFQKSFGIWQEDPAGMICKCAEADALRSSFPTMLGGLYIKAEVEENQSPKVSAPIFTAPIEGHPIKPELPASTESPVKQVRDLCKKDKIEEDDLVEFLKAVGLASDADLSLEDVEKSNSSSLPMAVEQWTEFRDKIREVA